MPLKFAANISMLFQEIPTLVSRFKAAKDAGFKYVECTFPYSEGMEELGEAREAAGVEHVLVNGWPGKQDLFYCHRLRKLGSHTGPRTDPIFVTRFMFPCLDMDLYGQPNVT